MLVGRREEALRLSVIRICLSDIYVTQAGLFYGLIALTRVVSKEKACSVFFSFNVDVLRDLTNGW